MHRVLVVEDEPDVRDMIATLLGTHGYEVSVARNGREGLDQLRTDRICVVLLDLTMPVMDGFEFRALQLQDPALAGVPVLCLTAMYEASEVQSRLAIPCLQKPFEQEALLALVELHCRAGQIPLHWC